MSIRFPVRVLATALTAALMFAGCGDDDSGDGAATTPAGSDPGQLHIHGLGVNPKDGALFIATHTGLFRSAPGQRTSERVGESFQDTMGFAVVGPDRFLGSGHPDMRDDLPPFLGLIESRDAGRTWTPVSLMGERDFHVLEAAGSRVYGYGSDFRTQRASLLVSDDGGRRWKERTPPEPFLSLAIDPSDTDRVIAAGQRRVHVSADAGRTWRPTEGEPALLTWLRSGDLVAVDLTGVVLRSDDVGKSWRRVGSVGGEPASVETGGDDELYAALHDGTVKRSVDGGASWSVRSTP